MNKQNKAIQPIIASVVGITYNGRQRVAAKLTAGEVLYLVRDPRNLFDPNAIKVENREGDQIGFLSRVLAELLFDRFDKFGQPVLATVESIVGGYADWANLGVRIAFSMPNNQASVSERKGKDKLVPIDTNEEKTLEALFSTIKLADEDGKITERRIDDLEPCILVNYLGGPFSRVRVRLHKEGISQMMISRLAANGMVFKIAK